MTTIELIDRECENIKALLIAKNKAYGNSFADPINVGTGFIKEIYVLKRSK